MNDYVGRCMAEAQTSSEVCVLTLTYAPRDDLADIILQPRHFQLFMKMLRKSGHKVRYFVAGEYGELKGRAHFHAILFFTDLKPGNGIAPGYQTHEAAFCREIPQKQICHIREWPHGHIKADWSISEKSIRYVCKYLLSEDKNNAWFSLSKKPAIGAEWFARKAAKARELDVLPYSFDYMPPGCDRNKSYMMTGATRRDYLNAITQDPERKKHMSEWVLKTFEKHERARVLKFLNAQPFEVLHEAFLQYREMKERDDVFVMLEKDRKYVKFITDLLDRSPSGILRQDENGKWYPKEELEYVPQKKIWKRKSGDG
ncbi:MAG: hypothetical protein Q4G22_05910 [Paracoccus sp. (in: a-proteobacteria)]|uniref:rolling circle replication-associated protein n=1 Tax=Paracoccus sp. TaxID=267 RepID=UPI0026DFB6D5|nr:hypothetical protein [Paracoccus sp. (in: a-proteobacteria)]MDO5631359.1 hypothetical protein [Paracoccus sp. (in: a-proteobacteria)]